MSSSSDKSSKLIELILEWMLLFLDLLILLFIITSSVFISSSSFNNFTFNNFSSSLILFCIHNSWFCLCFRISSNCSFSFLILSSSSDSLSFSFSFSSSIFLPSSSIIRSCSFFCFCRILSFFLLSLISFIFSSNLSFSNCNLSKTSFCCNSRITSSYSWILETRLFFSSLSSSCFFSASCLSQSFLCSSSVCSLITCFLTNSCCFSLSLFWLIKVDSRSFCSYSSFSFIFWYKSFFSSLIDSSLFSCE